MVRSATASVTFASIALITIPIVGMIILEVVRSIVIRFLFATPVLKRLERITTVAALRWATSFVIFRSFHSFYLLDLEENGK